MSRIGPQTSSRDHEPANDEARARKRQHDAPGLDRDKLEAVGVHKGHEHSAEKVVESAEEEQGHEARHRPHRSQRALGIELRWSLGAGIVLGVRGGVVLDLNRRQMGSAIAVNATVMMTHAPMPSIPIANPLKTDVSAKAIPLAVPTRPLARSWRSTGTTRVTVVDNATARKLPAIAPASTKTMKTQVSGYPSEGSEPSGATR